MRRIQFILLLILSIAALPHQAVVADDATPTPAGPTLLAPDDGATGSATPTFAWSALDGASNYLIEIASSPDFAEPILSDETAATEYTPIDPLPAGVTVFWRVVALLGAGASLVSHTREYGVESVATSTPLPFETTTETVEVLATETSTPVPTATTESESTDIATWTSTSIPTSAVVSPTVGQSSEPTPVTRSALSGKLSPGGYRLTGVGRSAGSVHPNVLGDRDLATIWTSPANHPGSAYFVLSLGSVKSIGAIKWVLGKTGCADQIRISVSTDRVTWTQVGRARNSVVGEWQTLSVNTRAKYVRFTFTNIRGDRWLGGLVEVEVHAQKATPTPTPTKTPIVPTPVADGIVRNASLESGNANWYLESGVRVSTANPRSGKQSLAVSSGGGYGDQKVTLQTGKNYALTVWGAMTKQFDVAYVGIVYRDSSGNRLTDLEPELIEFTATRYISQELTFQVPTRATRVNVIVWKREGAAGFYVDDFRIRQIGEIDNETPSGNHTGCQGLMVPGYFDPRTTSLWETTTSTGSGVALVIFAPNSGVGERFDPVWADVVQSSLEAGFTVLAYVQTDFGDRSSSAVIAEMEQYRDWYGVKDFFLDEADTTFESVERYRAMVRNVHQGGGIAVLNFGWMPHHAYMEFTDIAGVFEASYALYGDAYERPAWFYNYPANRFLHIVHSTPANKWTTVIERSKQRNAGYVWVTDDNTESYYKSLPSFWTKLNQTVTQGC